MTELVALPSRESQMRRPTPGGMVDQWPDTHLLGPRGIGPYVPCAICGDGTWARYGEVALCLAHAR